MPRLGTSLVRIARAEHPCLPLLLRQCRDLQSSRSELRWLREYLQDLRKLPSIPPPSKITRRCSTSKFCTPKSFRRRSRAVIFPSLVDLCKERASGKPLQYILGNQPFGALDILCRKNVLIPRNDTENYVLGLSQLILQCYKSFTGKGSSNEPCFSILDLCTGTGCIALLLHAELAPYFRKLSIYGVDISKHALQLARRNLKWNVSQGHLHSRALEEVQFVQGDVFKDIPDDAQFHFVVSNPPYITRDEFRSSQTSRSVRQYEPNSALVAVPSESSNKPGLSYFEAAEKIARQSGATLLACEMGNQEQFQASSETIAASEYWTSLQIWTDDAPVKDPGAQERADTDDMKLNGLKIPVKVVGRGHPRVIVATKRQI